MMRSQGRIFVAPRGEKALLGAYVPRKKYLAFSFSAEVPASEARRLLEEAGLEELAFLVSYGVAGSVPATLTTARRLWRAVKAAGATIHSAPARR